LSMSDNGERSTGERPKAMTARGAAFLGIGAMIGAGIFALLGEAGAVAGAAVWLSFLIAGVVALLLGYMVVKLGVRYPSSGGLIAYLLQGFGNGRLVGIASWLGYFAAIVIVCSMVAVSFARSRLTPARWQAPDVPLARLFGVADSAARQAGSVADRPKPPRASRGYDDEWRRLWRRLVRRGRDTQGLPQHPSGLERPQPPRARRRDLLSALLRAHPCFDGNCDPGDEYASVSSRAMAVDAQRAHSRVPADQT
jgi:Amino acid permease